MMTDVDELKVYIDRELNILSRMIKQQDRNIIKLMNMLEQKESITQYTPLLNESSIKIRSYMDN